ncbi:MAG: hypothetical protein OEW58_06640 [Gammaproteobacteria bacterium]|nr:hypothetical protein [Gammaproteobacteria bacterium]
MPSKNKLFLSTLLLIAVLFGGCMPTDRNPQDDESNNVSEPVY